MFLIASLFFSFQLIYAQKVEKVNTVFEYNRLPLKPLDQRVKSYQSEVILDYVKAIEEDKQKLEEEYQRELAEYPKLVKAWEQEKLEAEEKYNREMEEYNKKSTATKILEKQILEENTKPYLVVPTKPYPPVKKEHTYQKVFDGNVLAGTYLKMDGYSKGTDNPVKISVTLHGFENSEPELKTSQSSVYNSSTQSTTTVTNYWYEMNYKHPVSLKVEDPFAGILLNEMLAGTEVFSNYRSVTKQGSYPPFTKENVLADLQTKIVDDNMKKMNEYLNSQFGYSKVKDTVILYRVEAKKFNYDDYQQAFEAANMAYSLLASDRKMAVEKLNTSIAAWQKILEEYNPDDKKARIDGDIAIATYLNLASAYIWLDEYMKVEEMLVKITTLKPSKNEQKRAEQIKVFSRDQKARWEANKQ